MNPRDAVGGTAIAAGPEAVGPGPVDRGQAVVATAVQMHADRVLVGRARAGLVLVAPALAGSVPMARGVNVVADPGRVVQEVLAVVAMIVDRAMGGMETDMNRARNAHRSSRLM